MTKSISEDNKKFIPVKPPPLLTIIKKISFSEFMLLVIYSFFSWLMLKIVLQYIPYNTDTAFLRIKQDVIDTPFYKFAFFTHVYTAIFVLIAGYTQFSTGIRRNFPLVHKISGRIYALIVIIFAGPSGFYMGLYANGGITSQTAFCILAVLWIYFTVTAVVKIRQKDIQSHRAFVIRSFALTLSAITLRAWKYLIIFAFHPGPMDAYRIVAWLGWVPNLIIAELIINNFKLTKMKKLIFILTVFVIPAVIPSVILTGCGKNSNDKTATEDKKTNQDKKSKENTDQNDPNKGIYGLYTGDFEAVKYDETKDISYTNRITLSLDSIRSDVFFGHSVAAGNIRPFKGTYKVTSGAYAVEASEPGDDKYDGKFSFTIFPKNDSINGTWKANDGALPVSERKYSLKKREFVYDAATELPEEVGWAELYSQNPQYTDKGEFLTSDVLKVNPSMSLLKKEDIENMHKGDLEVIRNSIYARHGYSFKTRKMRFIFDSYVGWYMPVSTDVRNELTDTEKKNIDLIKRYEEHAEKYYDEYGR